MIWLIFAIFASLLVATYLATLCFTLHNFSPSALRDHCAKTGREGRDAWITENVDRGLLSLSLLRTAARGVVFALVFILVLGYGDEVRIAWQPVLLAVAIAAALTWLFTTVLASSLARYLHVRILAGGLWLVRAATMLCLPVVVGLSFLDEAVRRLSGATKTDEQMAEVELLHRIEDTHLQGRLNEDAAEMLENLVEFGSTDVGEVMTPRTDIEGIALTDDLDTVRDFIVNAGHSRIPVYGDDLDDIRGILYVKDLIQFIGRDLAEFKLQSLLRKTLNVPDTKPVSEMLGEFQRSEVHLAIVVDEYGGTKGLVTIEDVLEEIVGEIQDEHDPADEQPPTLNMIDDRTSEVDGRYHIDDLNEELSLDLPEDEEYDTIAGYVLAQLGHVPESGEAFETERARFTAVEASATHVSKINIELLGEISVNGNGNGNGNGTNGNAHNSQSPANAADTPRG